MPDYRRKLSRIPKLIRYSTSGLMGSVNPKAVPVFGRKYSFVNRYNKLEKLLKNYSIDEVLSSASQQFYGENIESLFNAPIQVQPSAFDSKELKEKYFEEISYLMAIDFQTFLSDDILQKVDRATMSVSLEGREPFLDHHVIEWAAQLPTTYKLNNDVSKFILKEITHRLLPTEMMERPKMGFTIPIENWLENELSELLHFYFDKDFVTRQGIFNPAEINRIKRSFFDGRRERAEKVWVILMFQMWFEKWLM
jgi:asparagine synthase (glutamine-hydrolysing)